MISGTTPRLTFGKNRSERMKTLLAVAADLYVTGTINTNTWRRQLSNEVAARCDSVDSAQVDRFMSNISRERRKEIRVACIGKVAERFFIGSKRADTDEEKAAKKATRIHEWGPKISEAIVRLREGRREICKISVCRESSESIGRQTTTILTFLGTCDQTELEAMGFPKPEEKKAVERSPARLGCRRPVHKDHELKEAVDEKYAEALNKLPPAARTVLNVAETLGVKPFAIASYAYQNPAFAKELRDAKGLYDMVRAA